MKAASPSLLFDRCYIHTIVEVVFYCSKRPVLFYLASVVPVNSTLSSLPQLLSSADSCKDTAGAIQEHLPIFSIKGFCLGEQRQ